MKLFNWFKQSGVNEAHAKIEESGALNASYIAGKIETELQSVLNEHSTMEQRMFSNYDDMFNNLCVHKIATLIHDAHYNIGGSSFNERRLTGFIINLDNGDTISMQLQDAAMPITIVVRLSAKGFPMGSNLDVPSRAYTLVSDDAYNDYKLIAKLLDDIQTLQYTREVISCIGQGE